MSITLADTDFAHHHYDERGDVLYLSVASYTGDAPSPHAYASPEGHGIEFDEDWKVIWTFKWSGKTIMSMPRSVVMRSTIMNHLIHHRAQLGVFLRLNEIEFPGMYGPSADDKKWWEAQSA